MKVDGVDHDVTQVLRQHVLLRLKRRKDKARADTR